MKEGKKSILRFNIFLSFKFFFNDLSLNSKKSLHQIKKFQKKKKKSIRRNLSTFNKNWIKKRRNSRRATLTFRGILVSWRKLCSEPHGGRGTHIHPILELLSGTSRQFPEAIYEQTFCHKAWRLMFLSVRVWLRKAFGGQYWVKWMNSNPSKCRLCENRDFVFLLTILTPPPQKNVT